MVKKFTRRNTTKYSRLGKKRKKLQVWRKPKGRHNKMRDCRKGYPPRVQEGYKNECSERNKFDGKVIVTVSSLAELDKVKKDEIIFVGRFGKKKKIELARKIVAKNLPTVNFNAKNFIKEFDKKNKPKKETKK